MQLCRSIQEGFEDRVRKLLDDGLHDRYDIVAWGITEISKVLNNRAGKKVRPIDCLDVMNIIGRIVKAGNVRRSAQIAIGDMDDLQYLNAKRWDLGNIPNWRDASNNSIVWVCI